MAADTASIGAPFAGWLTFIREAWAYRDIMPVVPVPDAGLPPPLQWIVAPTLASLAATGLPARRIFGEGGGKW